MTQGLGIAGRLVLLGTGNGVKGVFVGVFGHFSVVFWLLSKVSIFFKWLFYSFGCTYCNKWVLLYGYEKAGRIIFEKIICKDAGPFDFGERDECRSKLSAPQ